MSGEKRGAGRPRKPKVRTKGQDDQAVNPTIHVRVSAWTRDALHQLVKDGTYRAMGQAVDDIVKTHVMTDRPTNIVTLPRTSDDIEAYYPMLANDMEPGVFSSLNATDKALSVMVAFYVELNDIKVSEIVGCTIERVKNFRVSDIGVLAAGVGEARVLLSQRPRFWGRIMDQAENPDHPRGKQSDTLLARELFPAKKVTEVLNRISDEDGKVVRRPVQMDADFMDHAARMSMTPARFVRMFAQHADMPVNQVVSDLLEALNIIEQQQQLPESVTEPEVIVSEQEVIVDE